MAGRNTVEVKLSGFAELQQKLEHLPPAASRRILRRSVVAAVKPWRDEMIARVRRGFHHWTRKQSRYGKQKAFRAPVFGFLAKNIRISARVNKDLEATVAVGPARLGFWARFLEFGTTKMRAFPFIRPAYEVRKQEVLDELGKQLKEGLEREGLKLS